MDGIKQLRMLARQYYEEAMSPVNIQRMKMFRAVNDLKMERPVVLIDEIPFHELNFDGSLTLCCTDPVLRKAEDYLRKKLFQWKYFPADMILEPYYPLQKMIIESGYGLGFKEEVIYSDDEHVGISSHLYQDQLHSLEQLEMVTIPTVKYNKEETMTQYTKLSEAFGDILPVKLQGYYGAVGMWDLISIFRGMNNLLVDLIAEPEFSHQIAGKFCECNKNYLKQMEEEDLLELDLYTLHCTPGLCSDLGKDYDGGKVLRKHIWGRGSAQPFACVNKEMHEEFEIHYMKDVYSEFGLVYYGCCEPLDKKMDIVEKIPNLRKISISPWADVDVAAEAISKKYVLANKPNPALVSVNLDEDALKKEIGRTLAAIKRNGCSCDIVLKDISSVGHNLNNLVQWEQIVMKMVNSF